MLFLWIAVINAGGLVVIYLIWILLGRYPIFTSYNLGVVSLSPSTFAVGTCLGTSSSIDLLGIVVVASVSGAILGTAWNYVGLQIFAGIVLMVVAASSGISKILKAGSSIM
jgi:hypothetical protein